MENLRKSSSGGELTSPRPEGQFTLRQKLQLWAERLRVYRLIHEGRKEDVGFSEESPEEIHGEAAPEKETSD